MLEARLANDDTAAALLAAAQLKATQIGAVRWRDRIRSSRERLEQAARVSSS